MVNSILRAVTLVNKKTYIKLVQVFSDVLVAFLYFDICHYRQSNLAIENPEFSWPAVAGHIQ